VVRVGTVIGVGIFVLTGREAKEDIGLAVVISYVVSGTSSMLSVSRCVRVAGGS
jgi:APA family basic amino acid/polyamine antiporter